MLSAREFSFDSAFEVLRPSLSGDDRQQGFAKHLHLLVRKLIKEDPADTRNMFGGNRAQDVLALWG